MSMRFRGRIRRRRLRPVVSIPGAGGAIQILLALGLCLSLARFAWPAVDPLDVPRGTGPTPESHAQLPAAERIEQGVTGRAERGYVQYPVLALALLEVALREGRPDLARRLFEHVALTDTFEEFLTLPAYEELLRIEQEQATQA